MKYFTILIAFLCVFKLSFPQTYKFDSIPRSLIIDDEGDMRSGSCASPDGAIICDELTGYPTFSYLQTNGCCYTISPPVKNATYCWTFTAISTSVTLDCGWQITVFAGYAVWFSNFQLYKCAPDCSLVGSGLSFTGLTIGQCYTWCFDTHMTGGGGGGGFSTLCPYAIQTAPLPIELADFYCLSENNQIKLNWETLSENNCMEFQILKSADGFNFEQIGTVKGNGTSLSTHYYSFTDPSPSGMNYYRLKEIDNDLNYSLSEIIACDNSEEPLKTCYYDMLGRPVVLESAPPGIYMKEIITVHQKTRQIFYKSF